MSNTFTLRELAERVGQNPRTVRSYIEKGLLPGPDTVGRNARYGARHLARLRAIQALRDLDGLSLDEIRRRLLAATEEEIAAEAARLEQGREGPHPAEGGQPSTALALVRAIQQARAARDRVPSPDVLALSSESSHTTAAPALATMRLSAPERFLATRFWDHAAGAARRATAQPAFVIPVLPDVEIVVRGVHDRTRIARLERIADELRRRLLESDVDDQS